MTVARASATKPATAGLLSNTYVEYIFEPIIAQVWDGTAFSVQAAEIVLDSAFAMPFPTLALHVRVGAVRNFVSVMHAALTRSPDGRLLARTNEVGQWLLGAQVWSPTRRGYHLHELGVVDLDAYASRWSAGPDYLDQILPWLARATSPMPAPAVALARAGRLLAEAAELREGDAELGETLKALLQARIFEAAANRTDPDPEELRPIARRALAHLNLSPGSEALRWVQRAIEAYGLS